MLPGFLAAPPLPESPPWEAEDHWFAATLIALHRRYGPSLILTGPAAAWIYGTHLSPSPRTIDAYTIGSTPRTRAVGPEGRYRLITRTPPVELKRVMKVDGLRLAEPHLCLFDLARLLEPRKGIIAASSFLACRTGLRGAPRTGHNVEAWRRDAHALIAQAASLAPGLSHRFAPSRAIATLQAANGLAESPAEARFWEVIVRRGLPRPILQYPVDTRYGCKWADAAWPASALIVEVDGDAKFLGADGKERMLAERKRNLALEEAGWRALHVSWHDMDNEPLLLMRLESALAGRNVPDTPGARGALGAPGTTGAPGPLAA